MRLLEVEDVSKRFGGLSAVAGFSLDVEEGEIEGLIGPNGAGKTTVFNLVTGITRPDAGSIRLKGKDLVGVPPFRIAREGIARTFQNIRLFRSMTVLQNVKAAVDYEKTYEVAGAAFRSARFRQEEDRIDEFARGILQRLDLLDHADHPAGSLPYGSQRRVEIARALALEPSLLLLDEPAAGMNPNEVSTLAGLIRFIKAEFGLTVLLIEHQMGLVMNLCERIVVMDFGQVIAHGLPSEVRSDPKVLEAYLGRGAKVSRC